MKKKLLAMMMTLITHSVHAETVQSRILNLSMAPAEVTDPQTALGDRVPEAVLAQAKIKGNVVELNFFAVKDCDYWGRMGGYCPQVLEIVKATTLSLVRVDRTTCGDYYWAETPISVLRSEYEFLIIKDMRNAICEKMVIGFGDSEYNIKNISGQAQIKFVITEISEK